VNVTALLVLWFSFVTVILCAPSGAFSAMTNLAVVNVAEELFKLVTLIPVGTLIPTLASPLPEIEIETVLLCAPSLGDMELIEGVGPAVIEKAIELLELPLGLVT